MPHTALALATITDSAVHWTRDALEDAVPRRLSGFPRPEVRRARLPKLRPGPMLRTLDHVCTAQQDSTDCRPLQSTRRLAPGAARG